MIAELRSLRPLAFTLGAALILAAPLRAQESATNAIPVVAAPAEVAAAPAPAGPTIQAASVAVRHQVSDAKAAPMPSNQNQGQATALMIVGGAAVLTGLIIGSGAGYAISVGGAVVGLIGLYQYLQ
jgi:hypothetical protein